MKKRKGFSTTTVLMLTGGSMMLGLGVTSLAMVRDSHSGRSSSKQQANDLAEAGIHAMYQKIRTQMLVDGTHPSSFSPIALTYDTRNGTNREAGTYSARIAARSLHEYTVSAADNNVATRRSYSFTIESTGTAANGVTSILQATYTGSLDVSDGTYKQTVYGQQANGNGVPLSVCPGAIMSNAAIRITTNQGLRTYASANDAHVVANKGIEWKPASGSKDQFQNPNVIDIQGQFQVPGSSQYSAIYDFTVGPNGLGNNNGIKNYRSPFYAANDGNPELAANTVARREYPRPYPSSTMFDEWGVEWQSQASKGTKYTGDLSAGNMPPDRAGKKFLKAPVVINGDLQIPSGDTLRLMPVSEKPWENIVYVQGNIKNLGAIKNLGVTLVVLGKYSDSTSSRYEIEAEDSMYGTRDGVMQKANLMSLNPDADALKFTTNASSTTGLIYAGKGGVQIDGSPEFTGKLVAAGQQDIKINPQGGNSFVVHYDPKSGGNRHALGSAEDRAKITLPAGTIVRQFDADRLRSWLTVK